MTSHDLITQTVHKAAAQFGLTLYDFDGAEIKTPMRLGMVLQHYSHPKRPDIIEIGDLSINTVHRYAIKNDEKIPLTEREIDIIAALYLAQQTVSRAVLLKTIWNYVEDTETHTLETHIYRLRQKIENDPAKPEIVITTENGYKLGDA
jgi:DNA-binding response OmpR family regulator